MIFVAILGIHLQSSHYSIILSLVTPCILEFYVWLLVHLLLIYLCDSDVLKCSLGGSHVDVLSLLSEFHLKV